MYAVVPVTILVVVADMALFGQALQPYLTLSLLYLPLYIFVFELPHIIASLTSFADREYVEHYRRELFVVLPILIGAFALLSWYLFPVAVILYTCYTTYHVVRQQTGISLVLTKRRDNWHELWNHAGVVVGSSGMLVIFSKEFLGNFLLTPMSMVLFVSVVIFSVISLYIIYRTKPGLARWYVVAVWASVLASFIFFVLNYLFLAIFVLRFVHDVTAFMFYIVHDMNRNLGEAHNVVYGALQHLKIPILVAVPAFAILVALGLRLSTNSLTAGIFVIMTVGILHYYLESVMWKRTAPHRSHVNFS